jgi:hypothetical protein
MNSIRFKLTPVPPDSSSRLLHQGNDRANKVNATSVYQDLPARI